MVRNDGHILGTDEIIHAVADEVHTVHRQAHSAAS